MSHTYVWWASVYVINETRGAKNREEDLNLHSACEIKKF